MVIGCIVQARMGSSRLPGKALLKIDNDNPILYYVINQLSFSKILEKIIIATTDLEDDDQIEQFSKKIGIECFRGSADDVLDRYYQCAKKFSLSTIIRITADNPLIDPTIVDQVIKKFLSGSFDYVSNHIPRTFPQGTEVEVFSLKSLESAWQKSKKRSEREHVTPYFYNNPNLFRIGSVSYDDNISYLRWTVDKYNDFELVKMIISKIKNRPILMQDILELFYKEKSLFDINKDHILDEGYKKSLKED